MTTTYPNIIDGARDEVGAGFDVINPSTGVAAGRAIGADAAALNRAVKAARAAFPGWAATPWADRQAACNKIAGLIGGNAEELAKLLSTEQGKPLNGVGARFEIGGCQAWTSYTASLTLETEIIQDNEEGRVELQRVPIGVIGAITPWNWPVLIGVWHIIPAILAGNCVIIKPSENTPLSTLRLAEIMQDALPPGVVQALASEGDLGPLMTDHPGIDKISFTGSIPTGSKVMAGAARDIKRVTLELGGNDPGIVLPDVDPAAIAEGLFWGCFINNGQTCAALKRLYVHEDIHDAVTEALAGVAANMPMGDGLEEGSIVGPIQNRDQYNIVKDFVQDALDKGASLVTGGVPEGNDLFFPTTILTGVGPGMKLHDLEQFGPAIGITKWRDEDEVVRLANDDKCGLGASVWSGDPARARKLADRISAGSVWINKHGMIQPNAPFGGVRQSGIGVQFGVDGLRECTNVKTILS
ncbi:aldehyde dehydrogenase family protein [Paracoccus aurantiacus]|uniref:Aldehyde dehydrogenase family protein n=1 Tax=Paracoccus aurantiacus TaxID=2599412 RepID=A0A5C6S2A5_9RHOB|nr:aldehyde dehydrogenase family protein [Paracoccus aurantiacus]TXB67752.1 aldehyde dehydrogenase family protein [Paracoccus aurantiacus]